MQEHRSMFIRLPADVLASLEAKAGEMGITTTALIRALCMEYVAGRKMLHREEAANHINKLDTERAGAD